MRYFRNPNFISFCFLILIKPGCISGIPALGILDTLLNMIRIMLVLFTLIVLFKNAQLLPVNRLFGVTMLVVASILWEPISTLTGGGSIADFGALMNDLGIALVCYIGLRAGYDSFIEGVASFGRICAHQLPDRDFVPGRDVCNYEVFAKLLPELPDSVVRHLPAGVDNHAALECKRRFALHKTVCDCRGCRGDSVDDLAVDGDGAVLL